MNGKNKKILSVLISMILLILLFIVGINSLNTDSKYENLHINQEQLNIFYFNVGQAESIFITNNNSNMLIDCGNGSDGKYISNFLKSQGISKLDYLIGTHIDEDHIGGMNTILQELEVGTLYMPNSSYKDKKFYVDLQKYIEYNDINIKRIEPSKDVEYKIRKYNMEMLVC